MKTAAVVTVTTNRFELRKCIESVSKQTYPCKHYILFDGLLSLDEVNRQSYLFEHPVEICYWGGKIGGNGWAGQRWLSAAPHLLTEDVTFFCNDDDWYEANHVQTIMEKIEEGYDWAYSFRKIHDEKGNFICNDNCEALGEAADVWNVPGHRFVDWCMWGMRTELLKQISIVLNNSSPQVDRLFYATAKQLFPNFIGTNQHTFNFRLGGTCGVQKEFFEIGNADMIRRFNGSLPWMLNEQI